MKFTIGEKITAYNSYEFEQLSKEAAAVGLRLYVMRTYPARFGNGKIHECRVLPISEAVKHGSR